MKLCCGCGWKNSTAPIASAALKSGKNFGSSQLSPFTTVSSSAPLRPSPVCRREGHLGRGEAGALAVADERAEPLAGLVTIAVPLTLRLGGLPDVAGDEMGVDVDGAHVGALLVRGHRVYAAVVAALGG